MESILSSGSINRLFSLTENLRFFFDPVQLDLQLADLLVQLRKKILSLTVVLVSAIRKDSGKLLQELLSPLPDLLRMDPKFTGQLRNRLFPFYGLQRHLGFESAVMGLSHVLNHPIPPSGYGRLTCTLYPCPVFGEYYRYSKE